MFDTRNLREMSRQQLIDEIKDLEGRLLIATEKIELLNLQHRQYDSLMGYHNDMTYEERFKHNLDSERDIKDVEDSLEENSIKREYLEETEVGDRMVDIALEINQLQFDCAETFHPLKEGLKEDSEEYKQYKRHKNNFYAFISYFYENGKKSVFDVLSLATRLQKKIYTLDEEMKELSKG
jgi:hypothetical protein